MKVFLNGLLVVLLSVLVVAGCVHSPEDRVYSPGKGTGRLKKIAVLPFYNISGRRDAGRMVADTYVTELFKSGRYDVEEPGNVLQFMIREHVDTVGEMEIERIKILGRRLGVDAVLVGTVEEYDDGLRGVPTVSITARMVDSRTGRIVWSGHNKRRGDEYIIAFGVGMVRSASALSQKVINEMIETMRW